MIETQEFRDLEAGLAYDQASTVISSECNVAAMDGAMVYYDLLSAACDVTDQVRYLQARRLLDIHPRMPHWVSVRDEDEPLPEEMVTA